MQVYIIHNTSADVEYSTLALLNFKTVGSIDPIEFYVSQYLGQSYNPTEWDHVTYSIADVY